jgi:hypothetical protein
VKQAFVALVVCALALTAQAQWFGTPVGASTMPPYHPSVLILQRDSTIIAQALPPGCYTDLQGLLICPGHGAGGAIILPGTCTSPVPTANPTGGVAVNYTCASPTPFPLVTSTACVASPQYAAGVLSLPAGCVVPTGNYPAQIVAGICTSPSPTASPTGGIEINYTCATPYPTPSGAQQMIPCPTASTNIEITGTILPACAVGEISTPFPQTTPSPQATSTSTAGAPSIAFSGTSPYLFTVIFPQAAGAAPTNTPYDTVVLGTANLQNYWKMNDTGANYNNCPGTFADSGPANQPLTTPSPDPSGLYCGDASIASDSEGSVLFPGTETDYIVMPTVFPATPNPWTIEFAAQAFTGTGAEVPQLFDATNQMWCASATNAAVTGAVDVNNGNPDDVNVLAPFECDGKPMFIDMTYNGTLWITYFNGIPTLMSVGAPENQAVGAIGGNGGANANGNFPGRIAKMSLYTSAFSQATVTQHYFAWKCGSKPAGTCSL